MKIEWFELACKTIESEEKRRKALKAILTFSEEEKRDAMVLFSLNENEKKLFHQLLDDISDIEKWKLLSVHLMNSIQVPKEENPHTPHTPNQEGLKVVEPMETGGHSNSGWAPDRKRLKVPQILTACRCFADWFKSAKVGDVIFYRDIVEKMREANEELEDSSYNSLRSSANKTGISLLRNFPSQVELVSSKRSRGLRLKRKVIIEAEVIHNLIKDEENQKRLRTK